MEDVNFLLVLEDSCFEQLYQNMPIEMLQNGSEILPLAGSEQIFQMKFFVHQKLRTLRRTRNSLKFVEIQQIQEFNRILASI